MELEDKIVNNKSYLLENYPNTEMVIEEINMILDFNLSNEKIVEWVRLNQISIGIIEELLKKNESLYDINDGIHHLT